MNDFKNSALEELQESDDLAWGWGIKQVTPTLHEYNQKFIDDWACVFVAGIAAIGDMINREWTTDELLELKSMASSYGRQPNIGMTTSKGADLCIEFAKKKGYNLTKQVISMKTDAKTYLDNWREIHSWAKVNSKYYNDMQDNGELNETMFGAMEYWHSFRMKKIDGEYCVVDNYKGHLKYNIVKIKDLNWLLNWGNFFNTWFIYIPNTQSKPMNTRNIPYLTIEQAKNTDKDIVKARLEEVKNEKLWFKTYTGEYAIVRMLIDLNEVRKWR